MLTRYEVEIEVLLYLTTVTSMLHFFRTHQDTTTAR